MQEREISEILNDNPFDTDGPTQYEEWLYAVGMLAFSNIAGLTKAVESLSQRMSEHERLHNAANVAAMELPKTEDKEHKH